MEISEVLNLANQKYNGDIRIAIAATVYSEAVVFDCNNQVPVWADQEEINRLESEVNTFVNQTQNSNAGNDVSIATLPKDKIESVEWLDAQNHSESGENQKKYSDSELFAVILEANKSNVTISEAIKKVIFKDEKVNNYQIGYVKGLITQLLNTEAAPVTENPADATETANSEVLPTLAEAEKVEENQNP